MSPLGTALGPLPAIPIFGALPTGDLPFGFAGLLVPVVAGFLAGAPSGPRSARALDGVRLPAVSSSALAGGVVGGVLLGLLAWASAGAPGPGRLADVGPSPVRSALAALDRAGARRSRSAWPREPSRRAERGRDRAPVG